MRFKHLWLVFVVQLFVGLTSSSWWYFSQHDVVTNGRSRLLCDIVPDFNKRQQRICYKYPQLINTLLKGVKMGIRECQYQFRFQRWNCTVFPNDPSLFGKSLVRGGSRELSFVHAITTASSIYNLAQSCSGGLPQCGCMSESYNSIRQNAVFKWEGCEHVVKFSTNFARRFIDAADLRYSDGKSKFALHNNRVGRLVVQKTIKRVCKCHGLSGSCSLQTCWSTLPHFRHIGDILRDRYDSATEITFTPSGYIIPNNPRHRKPNKYNMIYFQRSPNYCKENPSKGALGTRHRLCHGDGDDESACDILCCRQRYGYSVFHLTQLCNCTFTWCCHVYCSNCSITKTEYRCQ